MKRIVLAVMLIGSLGVAVAVAEPPSLTSTQIDTNTLDNNRLFFSVEQRQEGRQNFDQGSRNEQLAKPAAQTQQGKPSHPMPLPLDAVLRYTGVVHSDRGVQILLNGLPWRPGQLAVISVRMQPSTQLIELETSNGEVYRLLPGDLIEVKQ